MRRWTRGGLGASALCLAALAARAEAPAPRRSAQEAASLQAAFDHDLCTRDDRALRKLNRALGRKQATAR